MDYRRRIERIVRDTVAAFKAGENIAGRIFGESKASAYMPKRKSSSSHGSSKRSKGAPYLYRSKRTQPKAELKAYDVAQSGNAFRTPAAATSLSPVLNVPIPGNDLFNRIGRKIYMKSLQVTGYIASNGNVTDYGDIGRLFLIYDEQPNGAAPTVANIIQDATAGAATTGTSLTNLNNRQRFKIIRDRKVYLPPTNVVAGTPTMPPSMARTDDHNIFALDWFIKLNRLETVFNQNSNGNIGDIASGSLYLMFVSNANDAHYAMTYNARLRFYD